MPSIFRSHHNPEHRMPRPKRPCPSCGSPMSADAAMCRSCRPTYERTPETRAKMSAATKGKPKPHLQGRSRPQHSTMMQEWWTPERKEMRRLEMLQRNPSARYHGLSARAAKRLVDAAGQCQVCGHNGTESRLSVHHVDRNKRNQTPSNLLVLCHQCHMREHAAAKETGWDVYHQKRKMSPG